MLNTFVIGYLVLSVLIGLLATLRVHNTSDFVSAGRSLSLVMVTSLMFATWFGSEAILGAPPVFLEEGIGGIVADPFGAAFCLIFAGFFFARALYRRNMLTIGDFFRQKYGREAEFISSTAIMLSYLGWVSAQMIALGVVFSTLTGGALSQDEGILIGAAIIIFYTMFGGMWSVALTSFVQMIVMVACLAVIAWVVVGKAGGVEAVYAHAEAAGKLDGFWPEWNLASILAFVGAFVTLALGSIPQQDVFQRMNSSRNENIAVYGAVLGGVLYLIFCMLPLFLTYSVVIIDPALAERVMAQDSQQVLPTFIQQDLPLVLQVIFFGALLAAIMSTASGTLLAPSTVFTENLLKPFLGKQSDRQFLWTLRLSVLGFGAFVTWFAIASNATIFGMVENAYKVTLVAAFVPLTAGIYWSRANRAGALTSMVAGLAVWIALEILAPEGICPPQLAGLGAAIVGMIAGSLLSRRANIGAHHHGS
ncbi:sodium:solute symporter family protein [Amnimonas aquatica]|uniref:Sodium:solute symporter n=1 Tax=Amnimonas aquatica TaxID=2094561 RepID=A0A2P6ARQ5_9GAMM|nr:sodium:solute symporter family protein [Amnimonas aquatica]PQA38303.1 sodium:solute symporter [Amnimonas aquatica]